VDKIIPYGEAKKQLSRHLEAKDVKEAEQVLGRCTDETRVQLYNEMSPHQLGMLMSLGDLGWTASELDRDRLVVALSHDPELLDEKGQLYPVEAVAVAFSLSDRDDAASLYQEDELVRNIVSLAFLVELPASIPLDDYDEIEEWLSNHWLSNFEPDLDDLLEYDEEVLKSITEDMREEAREEVRMIQKALQRRAEKVEKEMFDI
jgi:hypothetical protein